MSAADAVAQARTRKKHPSKMALAAHPPHHHTDPTPRRAFLIPLVKRPLPVVAPQDFFRALSNAFSLRFLSRSFFWRATAVAPERDKGGNNHAVEREAGHAGLLPCDAGAPSNINTHWRVRTASRCRARRKTSGGAAPPAVAVTPKNADIILREIINIFVIYKFYNSGVVSSADGTTGTTERRRART